MRDVVFKSLDRDFLKNNVHEFIAMCQRNMDGEYWSETHFLSDLPGKWNYSFVVMDAGNIIMAFIIASEKEASIHIHKFVVDGPYQKKGWGARMLEHIGKQSAKPLTLKVRKDNAPAIAFYERNGFLISGGQQELYTMTRSNI